MGGGLGGFVRRDFWGWFGKVCAGGLLGRVCAEGGAQPLSAEPKATRKARGARRRRAGCARWLRLAGAAGKAKQPSPVRERLR